MISEKAELTDIQKFDLLKQGREGAKRINLKGSRAKRATYEVAKTDGERSARYLERQEHLVPGKGQYVRLTGPYAFRP